MGQGALRVTDEHVGTILMSLMPDLPNSFTDAIRDRYVLEREIGAGGMATVHLARDVRHNRHVAIKVLKPELAASIGSDRFLKEIEIAARLTHPHIIPLHDSGEAAGFLFYVMPYIDGETLRARLLREKRVDAADALEIVEKVGDALSYAHRQEVLHRDIKPENIMFSEGHPMVADFGIARAVSTAGGATLTRTGLAIGTPGYMSPEQAIGARELDHRTDVFSLGCVLYEMLVGETPSTWMSDDSLRTSTLTGIPDDHRTKLSGVDKPIEKALVRALAMRANDRFDTVDAFVRALKGEEAPIRRYSDTEVTEIVKQAVDNQIAYPTEEGMSLDTVQQIANDVGLSPSRVERAARNVERRESQPTEVSSGAGNFWLGSPMMLSSERMITGEAAAEATEEIVDEVQATFVTEGLLNTRGNSLTWRTTDPSVGQTRNIQVRVTARSGNTRVQVQERVGELATALYTSILVGGGVGGIGVILGVGLGALGAGLESALLSAAWFGGMYGLTRSIFTAVTRKKKDELEDLSDRLADIAADSALGIQAGEKTIT